MAKTYGCLLLICLTQQLLCSFAIPSGVSFLSDHVPCGKTIESGHIVICLNHAFPRLTFEFESLSSSLSLTSKKLDHTTTVSINTIETFLNENETVELSVAVLDPSLFQALGKIMNPLRNDSELRGVSDSGDEEDSDGYESSAEPRGTDSPDMSQPEEENGEKIAGEVKDGAFNENNTGCAGGKCNVSCERSCRVHSFGSKSLSSDEANGDEARSVALETPATAPSPPTDPKPHRTQVGSGLIPGAQVFHAHQETQALKESFSEDSESCCPLRLIFLFLGLCIARIEF